MNEDLDKLYGEWTKATGNLAWGVQKVFRDVLGAAQDRKTTLVYGTDYGLNGACLVNTIGVALRTGGGHGIPSAHYGEVVSLFDRINSMLYEANANDKPGIVSPLAADILLSHFAEDEVPEPGSEGDGITPDEAVAMFDAMKYREPSDEEVAREIANLFTEAPVAATLTINEEKLAEFSLVEHSARNDTTLTD